MPELRETAESGYHVEAAENKANGSVHTNLSEWAKSIAITAPGTIANGNAPCTPSLGLKAARLVQAGLPWPGEEALEHGTRKLVMDQGVPWCIKTVRCVS
jgi:hypothetical protein